MVKSTLTHGNVPMIVSHKHKFIFIHLGRTAGRSLTVALARSCGAEDVVTNAKGLQRNYAGFRRHFRATEIRKKVGREIFDEYFKFTIERNPWDKFISRYWSYAGHANKPLYKKFPEFVTGKPLDFKTWFDIRILQGNLLGFGHYRFPRSSRSYTENDRIIVDFIGRHENLAEHVAILSDRLKIELDKHYGARRHKERRPYTELFDERMNRIVERYFAKDLALLGYRFGESPPLDYIEPNPR